MSAWWYVAGFAVMGTGGFVAVVGLTRGQPIRREPEAQTLIGESGTFAAELAAIDTPAPPNYHSGEYPLVEVLAVEVAEPAQVAEPVEHVARHAATERVLSDARPWLTPALNQESTPFFWATGEMPTYDVDQLSATNSWNRAALRELLDMDAEEAA